VIVISVFSQAFCCNLCAKRDLAAQFHEQAVYDRGSPIKILHKYHKKDPASTAKALWHEVIA